MDSEPLARPDSAPESGSEVASEPRPAILPREEYVEQAYFFRAFRERLLDGLPTQDILARVIEELLSSTKLPLAVSFLLSDIRLHGAMAPAIRRLSHYFTGFQAHVVAEAERDVSRFSMDQALLLLEREASYKADRPTVAGLFVYQFEAICRNRLGYTDSLVGMATDPFYDESWRDFILTLRSQLGDVDFADLLYLRSEAHLADRQRRDPEATARRTILFGLREGKIARANRGRDPLYLFAALQRQLGYPEVPRARRQEPLEARLAVLEQRVQQLENRLKLAEMNLAATSGANPGSFKSYGEDSIDLEAIRVKPEDTAGVPSGWGRPSGNLPPSS